MKIAECLSEPTLVTALTALIHMTSNCDETLKKDEDMGRRVVKITGNYGKKSY